MPNRSETISRRNFLKRYGIPAAVTAGAVLAFGPKTLLAQDGGNSGESGSKEKSHKKEIHVNVGKPILWPPKDNNLVGTLNADNQLDQHSSRMPSVEFPMTNTGTEVILLEQPSAIGITDYYSEEPFTVDVRDADYAPIGESYSWKPGEELIFTVKYFIGHIAGLVATNKIPTWQLDYTFFTQEGGRGQEITHVVDETPIWFRIEVEESDEVEREGRQTQNTENMISEEILDTINDFLN